MGFYSNIGRRSKIVIEQIKQICSKYKIDFRGYNYSILDSILYILLDKGIIDISDLEKEEFANNNNSWRISGIILRSFSDNWIRDYPERRLSTLSDERDTIYFFGKSSNFLETAALFNYNFTKEVLDTIDIKYTRYGSKKQHNLRVKIK